MQTRLPIQTQSHGTKHELHQARRSSVREKDACRYSDASVTVGMNPIHDTAALHKLRVSIAGDYQDYTASKEPKCQAVH